MKNTLYDLLELSKAASQEAILSSYQRLSAKIVDTDPDATNAKKVLNEAFSTLSDPTRRIRYDKSLDDAASFSEVVIYNDEGISPIKKLLFAGLLIGACGFGYNKYLTLKDKEAAFIEKERARAAEVLAASQRAEQAEIRAEKERQAQQLRQDRQQERQQEYQQQQEQEAARRLGAQISQTNAYAEERARKELESQARQQQRDKDSAERQQKAEIQNRLAKEKAYLRQLESENNRYRRY